MEELKRGARLEVTADQEIVNAYLDGNVWEFEMDHWSQYCWQRRWRIFGKLSPEIRWLLAREPNPLQNDILTYDWYGAAPTEDPVLQRPILEAVVQDIDDYPFLLAAARESYFARMVRVLGRTFRHEGFIARKSRRVRVRRQRWARALEYAIQVARVRSSGPLFSGVR